MKYFFKNMTSDELEDIIRDVFKAGVLYGENTIKTGMSILMYNDEDEVVSSTLEDIFDGKYNK